MKVRGGRFLLNPAGVESTAAVVAEIEDTRRWQTGRYRNGTPLHHDDETDWQLSPETTLKFSDCDRAVSFTIAWKSAADRRAALLKLDRMIEALCDFRSALVEEQILYIARRRAARLAGPPPPSKEEPDAAQR